MADGVIRVATDPAYPPQSSYDEATNTWEGFDIDVANEISKRMGLTQPVDWQRRPGLSSPRQLERSVGRVGRVRPH
jgi:ABC-type amino acid transport substrate-binding protein